MPFPVKTFTTPHLTVEYDRYSLLINGQRQVIRSGAMHYFRLPSQNLWRDRLQKLKSAGYNTVDLYFNWGFHSTAPDEYDFEGVRDVEALLAIVEELGLYLIARPGPYINAEVSGGGFPNWLLADKTVRLRHRNADGGFEWCDKYMDYVTQWWRQIVPKILKCKTLIAMQIENEYATLEVEPDYMDGLYQLTRKLGVTVPLFHNDLYAAGLYEDIVDLYAFDNYSVTSFQDNWREQSETFAVLDNVEDSLRPFCEERPLFVAELQAGWYATWKGHSYDEIVNYLGRDHIGISTRSLIGQGLTMFNHYKAIGGTNWEYIGSTDTYTSYDFAAPISETGVVTERLYEAKNINLMLAAFSGLAATKRVDPSAFFKAQDGFYSMRQSIESPEEQWLFLRNLDDTEKSFCLSDTVTTTLKPHEALMLPLGIHLDGGMTLTLSTSEVFYQSSHVLLVKADRKTRFVLTSADEQSPSAKLVQGEGTFTIDKAHLTIETPELTDENYTVFQVNEITVICLSQALVDRTWVLSDSALSAASDDAFSKILIGPDFIADSSQPAFQHLPVLGLQVLPTGECRQLTFDGEIPEPEPPAFSDWKVDNISAPLYQDSEFFAVSAAGLDFDTNHFYNGSAWYRYHLPQHAKTITIDARHLWAAYINGQPVGHGAHFLTTHGEEKVDLVTIPLTLDEDVDEQELVILVDSLGHPKGFHDDAQQPQGLLQFLINDKPFTEELHYSIGFSKAQSKGRSEKEVPVVRLSSKFSLPALPNIEAPLLLDVQALSAYDRVNINLNNVLVGRYWKDCQAQQRFYLPPGILKEGDKNTLEVVVMQFGSLLNINEVLEIASEISLTFDAFSYKALDSF